MDFDDFEFFGKVIDKKNILDSILATDISVATSVKAGQNCSIQEEKAKILLDAMYTNMNIGDVCNLYLEKNTIKEKIKFRIKLIVDKLIKWKLKPLIDLQREFNSKIYQYETLKNIEKELDKNSVFWVCKYAGDEHDACVSAILLFAEYIKFRADQNVVVVFFIDSDWDYKFIIFLIAILDELEVDSVLFAFYDYAVFNIFRNKIDIICTNDLDFPFQGKFMITNNIKVYEKNKLEAIFYKYGAENIVVKTLLYAEHNRGSI